MKMYLLLLLPTLLISGCARNVQRYDNDTVAYCSAMGNRVAHDEMMRRIQQGDMMPFEARRAYRRYTIDQYRESAEGLLCIGMKNHNPVEGVTVQAQGHNESYSGDVPIVSVKCNGKSGTYSSMDKSFFYDGHVYSAPDSSNLCALVN